MGQTLSLLSDFSFLFSILSFITPWVVSVVLGFVFLDPIFGDNLGLPPRAPSNLVLFSPSWQNVGAKALSRLLHGPFDDPIL